jgi:hypothetical protein
VSAKNIRFYGLLGPDKKITKTMEDYETSFVGIVNQHAVADRVAARSFCDSLNLEIRSMLRIKCEEWIPLNRLIRVWSNETADGTTQADLWNDVCRAFKDGHLDDDGPRYLVIDNGQVLSPKDPALWRYLRPLGDRIVLSKEAMHDLALWCNKSPPSCRADGTKGENQPSRQSEHLRRAPEAMIIGQITSEYHRAGTAGEKPPNIKQVSRPVQLALQQKGFRASKRQIEELAGADEFKLLRWPPGKRRR